MHTLRTDQGGENQMIEKILIFIGAVHTAAFLLGVADVIHYRAYIGTTDRVLAPKTEYEELKAFKSQWEANLETIELIKAFKCSPEQEPQP